MPGIAAILTQKYEVKNAQVIDEMACSMWHEVFYKKDTLTECSIPFVACRVHLNIINTAPQPILNENGTLMIMMDGEIYQHDDLKNRLISAGHEFKTDSDAELILHLYENLGENFLDELDGRFLVLIHDIKNNKTLVANDYLGLYRAFYAEIDGTFVIATELKCILKLKGHSFDLNRGKIPEYFLYGAILDDQTFFKEIRRLPPASLWEYDHNSHGNISRKKYFDFACLSNDTSLDKTEFTREYAKCFEQILPVYLRGDVGLSLTGGCDSRALLAVMTHLGYSVPCYTWCGPYRDSLDTKLARKIARCAGQMLNVFVLGKDFFENFPEYARRTIYISDGSADVFKSHEIYFNKLVRDVSPIRVTGAYGSEFVSGNTYFLSQHKVDERMFSDHFLSDIGDFRSYLHAFESQESFIDGMRWLFSSGMYALECSQVHVRWPYLDKKLVSLIFNHDDSYRAGSSIQKFITQSRCADMAGIPFDKGTYIKPDNMLKNVRIGFNSMVIRFLSTLDNAYLHPDVPDCCVRLDPFVRSLGLEKLILGHRNLVAYRRWIKNEIRGFIRGILCDEQTLSRSYYNPDFIKKIVHDHFSNRANYMTEIGKIVSFELWHRLFVD